MISTLSRYFGLRFLTTLVAVLLGVFALIILLDYVEQMRRMSDVPNISALLVAKISLFRVPQIAERRTSSTTSPAAGSVGSGTDSIRMSCRPW